MGRRYWSQCFYASGVVGKKVGGVESCNFPTDDVKGTQNFNSASGLSPKWGYFRPKCSDKKIFRQTATTPLAAAAAADDDDDDDDYNDDDDDDDDDAGEAAKDDNGGDLDDPAGMLTSRLLIRFFLEIHMDGKNFRMVSGLEKLAQDRTVSNSAEKKHAGNCSNQVTTVRTLKLLPTHKQKHIFVDYTPGIN